MQVKIIGTKHNIQCLECGNTWGVYLTEDNKLPEGWNVCLKCAAKKLNVKENVKNVREELYQSA